MAKRAYTWVWTARIKRETLPTLQDLAERLGFVVMRKGGKLGDPSPPALLDALAAAYRDNPDVIADALRQVGVVNPPPNQS